MHSLRSRTTLAFTAVAAVSVTALATPAHGQSTQTAPAPMPPHPMMMQPDPRPAPDHQHMHGMTAQPPARRVEGSDDPRVLVTLPEPMQEHMLANMRDHLATLNTVIGEIADNKLDAARKLLEERLGMSSLPLHHAAEMAPFFPGPMQDAGTSMHRAASRLAIALQDASVAGTFDSMRQVNAALHEVTSACVACHAGYRLR